MRIVFFLIIICGCWCRVFAQDSVRAEIVVQKLKELRSRISDIQSQENTPLHSNLHNSRTIINKAILRLDTKSDDQMPKEYVESLEYLKQMTTNVKVNDADAKMQFSHALIKDLQIKFPPSNEGQLNSMHAGKLATVKVITKRNGQEIKEYRVRCSPLGFDVDYTRPYLSFKRLTSPADENIVPGIYKIWITRDGDFKMLKEIETEISPDSDNTIVFTVD